MFCVPGFDWSPARGNWEFLGDHTGLCGAVWQIRLGTSACAIEFCCSPWDTGRLWVCSQVSPRVLVGSCPSPFLETAFLQALSSWLPGSQGDGLAPGWLRWLCFLKHKCSWLTNLIGVVASLSPNWNVCGYSTGEHVCAACLCFMLWVKVCACQIPAVICPREVLFFFHGLCLRECKNPGWEVCNDAQLSPF